MAQGNASVPAADRAGNPGATERHGPGQLADWVLLLTDEAGVVTAHYMDIVATVTSLPKYGTLAADARSLGSGNSYDEWGVGRSDATALAWRQGDGRHAQFFDAGEGSARRIDPTPTGQRPLGPCYGLDTSNLNGVASGVDGYRHCKENYGVGNAAVAPLRRNSGDVATLKRLRRHRVVYYHPFKDYVGIDAFEYAVPRPSRNLLARNPISSASVEYPRRGRGAAATRPPRNIHVVAAAPPRRPASAEYRHPRCRRGAAATFRAGPRRDRARTTSPLGISARHSAVGPRPAPDN